jgi:hypothetical protein
LSLKPNVAYLALNSERNQRGLMRQVIFPPGQLAGYFELLDKVYGSGGRHRRPQEVWLHADLSG